MVYIDPPFGIKYGYNFQPFVNKRDVKDQKDEDVTQEPETIKAFRDTRELGIHSYLTYLRDRLLLAKELLTESGSCFVQISDENLHHVREIMDEVFKPENFVNLIWFKKTGVPVSAGLTTLGDYLIWFAKDKKQLKFRRLFKERLQEMLNIGFHYVELPNGKCIKLTTNQLQGLEDIPKGKRFQTAPIVSGGEKSPDFNYNGKTYSPPGGENWKTDIAGMKRLAELGRLFPVGKTLTFKKYHEDFPYTYYTNIWDDTMQSTFASDKIYVVQTNTKIVQRCMLMTTDPGDLVLDPICGSGTTAYVAEQWGRRWITCDTSRLSIALAKQRLMTSIFDYYGLAHPNEGVSSGFNYENVPHVTLKSIANNEASKGEMLYDKPY